jgi:hypothetical protein
MHNVESLDYSQNNNNTATQDLLLVYKKIGWLSFQVAVVFTITFAIYPGALYATKLHFLSASPSEVTWFVIIMGSLFNIFDTIGRYYGGKVKLCSK